MIRLNCSGNSSYPGELNDFATPMHRSEFYFTMLCGFRPHDSRKHCYYLKILLIY